MLERSVVYDFIVRSLLVVGIALAMIRTGQMAGTWFLSLDIPYAGRIGFVIGATLVFSVFALLYRGYGTYKNNELGA